MLADEAFHSPPVRFVIGHKWVRADLNHRTPPCEGGVTTELDHEPVQCSTLDEE